MKHAWIALALAAAGCSAESLAAPPPVPVPTSNYDRTCKAASDCVTTDLSTSGTDMCCPSCTSIALSHTGFDKLTADCKAPNKHGCPPLSCLMPLVHAECKASLCVTGNGILPKK